MKDLFIPNPFTFKTSMEIALEVTSPVLASEDRESLKSLLCQVSNYLKSTTLSISPDEKRQLLSCIGAFKQSETCLWIREDFLNALLDVERQCSRESYSA